MFKKYGGRINEFFCEFFGAEMRVRNYIHSEEHNNVLNDIDDSDSVGLDDEDDSSSTGTLDYGDSDICDDSSISTRNEE